MNREYKIRSYSFTVWKEHLYIPQVFFNGILKIRIPEGCITNIYQFPAYIRKASWLYSKMIQVGACLYFSPDFGKELVCFDMETEQFQVIPVNTDVSEGNRPYFRCIYYAHNYLYMFPSRAKGILKYDIKTRQIRYLDQHSAIWNDDENYFRQQYEVVNNILYIPFTHRGEILMMDLATEQIRTVPVEGMRGCATINYNNGYMWLASWHELELYRWNIETGEWRTYRNFPDDVQVRSYTFANSYTLGDYILYFPVDGEAAVLFDTGKEMIVDTCSIPDRGDEPVSFYCGKKEGNQIYALTAGYEGIRRFSVMDGHIVCESYLDFDCIRNRKMIDRYFWMEGNVAFEKDAGDLEHFIHLL